MATLIRYTWRRESHLTAISSLLFNREIFFFFLEVNERDRRKLSPKRMKEEEERKIWVQRGEGERDR